MPTLTFEKITKASFDAGMKTLIWSITYVNAPQVQAGQAQGVVNNIVPKGMREDEVSRQICAVILLSNTSMQCLNFLAMYILPGSTCHWNSKKWCSLSCSIQRQGRGERYVSTLFLGFCSHGTQEFDGYLFDVYASSL